MARKKPEPHSGKPEDVRRRAAKRNAKRNRQMTARRLLTQQRREKAVNLIVQEKKSLAEVGRVLGISRQSVWELVRGYVDQVNAMAIEQPAELRQQQLDRIELLITEWLPKAQNDQAALSTLTRLLERQAKLAGLDAAIILEHQGAGGGPINIADARARVMGRVSEIAARLNQEISPTDAPPAIPPTGEGSLDR
jgi:hypothetical protein